MRTEATDNASVNFVKYKGDYYVSTETNFMRRVDPQSLETKEKVSHISQDKGLSGRHKPWHTIRGQHGGRWVNAHGSDRDDAVH